MARLYHASRRQLNARMSRLRTLTTALLRALRQPGRWPSLLVSVARVVRAKGLRGLREGISWWGAQAAIAPAPASPPDAPNATPTVPWFLRADGPYRDWVRDHVDVSPARRAALEKALARLPHPLPQFVVGVLPACGSDERMAESLDSVRTQVYDSSRVHSLPLPGADASAATLLLRNAAADWVVFLREGDRLAPAALAEAALFAAEHPDADVLYSDEDCLTPEGIAFAPAFKPEFSPDLLDAADFTARLLLVRRDAFERLGGLRPGFEPAAEYDLSLRAAEAGLRFARIPKVLYRRRTENLTAPAAPTLASSDADTRRHHAARLALAESLARRGASRAVIRDGAAAGTFRVVYPLPEPRPLVSIIIPFRDRPELLRTCVESILTRTAYAPYEIILADNGSTETETHRLLARLATFPAVRVVRLEMPFNFSAINNAAAREARGEYLLLLNNDTQVISEDWLDSLLRQCARPGVGAVGATLLFPDGTLQHAGVALGVTGLAGHPWAGLREDEVPGGGWHRHAREVTAVTAACLMTPRTVWETLGGLDERFVVCGNDVDYCLRARRALGLRVLHAPDARLYHYETQSRDASKVLQQDLDMSAVSYGPHLGKTDPHFNPNLTVVTTRATLRTPGEPGEPEPPAPVGPLPPPAHPAHPHYTVKEALSLP